MVTFDIHDKGWGWFYSFCLFCSTSSKIVWSQPNSWTSFDVFDWQLAIVVISLADHGHILKRLCIVVFIVLTDHRDSLSLAALTPAVIPCRHWNNIWDRRSRCEGWAAGMIYSGSEHNSAWKSPETTRPITEAGAWLREPGRSWRIVQLFFRAEWYRDLQSIILASSSKWSSTVKPHGWPRLRGGGPPSHRALPWDLLWLGPAALVLFP